MKSSNGVGDNDFDFSQSSTSEKQKLKTSRSLKKLNDHKFKHYHAAQRNVWC